MVNSRYELEAPVTRIYYVGTSVFTGEVQALCLTDFTSDLVIGNIPGVHPNIVGDFGKTAEEEIQHDEFGKTAEEEM